MFSIEQSLYLSDIETLYELIETEKGTGIYIPPIFTGNCFAGKAALCQLLNTWIRSTDSSESIFTNLNDSDNDIENFLKEPVNLLACLMTINQGRKIFGKVEGIDLSRKILKKAVAKLRETRPRINFENEKYFAGKPGPVRVYCFDHSKDIEYQYNDWLYQTSDVIDDDDAINEDDIEKFYIATIKHLLKPHKKSLLEQALTRSTIQLVTAIIKELFENTDRHAKNDFGPYSNVPLNPNARAIFMEIHKGTKEYFNKKVEIDDPLFNYFNNPKLFVSENELKTFLEISVLDSGPGFTQRRSGTPLNKLGLFAEIDYVFDCLIELDTGLRRRGLKRVADLLGPTGGFFRLRTGRVCLYWDYLLHGFKASEHKNKAFEREAAKRKFFDWQKGDKSWSKLYPASGTLITIFYPLN